MTRTLAFAERNLKELLRDPLSYIFCLGFPLIMMLVMTVVNESIPPEAGMVIFRIDHLTGGIAVFGLSFLMLFTCLNISKDRSGAFLTRLYASPLRPVDFIMGYILPVLVLSLLQLIITFTAGFIVSLITEVEVNILGCLLAVVTMLPSALYFIGFGLLFGTLFSEKAAPGLCSIIISLASFLGCVWFDAESLGGIMFDICKVLPFYHSTAAARAATMLEFESYGIHMLISSAYALVILVVSVLLFRGKMKADVS